MGLCFVTGGTLSCIGSDFFAIIEEQEHKNIADRGWTPRAKCTPHGGRVGVDWGDCGWGLVGGCVGG